MERKLQILILDDEEVVCTRLKPALEKEGYSVETFTDSLKAKERLEAQRFDIVVTDLKMANIGGLELLRLIKDNWPETRVIIISGFATVDVTRAAFQSGVHDVIAKPFKIGQLKDVIDRLSEEINKSNE